MANSEQYINDPSLTGTANTLASAVSSTSATTISVTSSTGFPSVGNFRLLVDSELMLCTALSGTTWTVTRGIEGSTAATHNSGAYVFQPLTAGAISTIRANQSQVGLTANLPSTTVAYQGDTYRCTDSSYEFIYNGSSWQAFWMGIPVTVPPSASSFTTLGTGSVVQGNDGTSLLLEPGTSSWFWAIQSPGLSVPYSVQAGFSVVFMGGSSGNDDLGGVCNSDGTKLAFLTWTPIEREYNIQWNNSANSYNSSPGTPASAQSPALLFTKISLTSSHRTYYVGDGIDWVQLYQESNTAFLTTSKVGIGTYGGNDSLATVTRCFHYAVTSP